ncbi:hypothetical protein GCM10027589_16030 [Actinocorallia lasiicapitis]
MRSRILLNLAAFATLGVVLIIWALTSIVTVDALRRPYTVTAEFDSSPGLRSDLEVSYLGVRVGTVESVRLDTGKVIVTMHMNKDSRVPNNVDAAVLRKSAVGEPYIEMEPQPNVAAGPLLKAGDRIPLERTHVAPEYKALFDKFGDLLKAVRPEDAKTLSRELAAGLEGRDQTLRDIIGDAHQLTGTLAANAKVLDDLSVQLTELTGTLASGGPALANGLNGLAAFMDALKASRGDLDGVLERGPRFLTNVQSLLDKSRPGFRCLLSALAWQTPHVFTPSAKTDIQHALGLLTTELPNVANNVVKKEKTGHSYANVTIAITVAGPGNAAVQYTKPAVLPEKPDLYYCKGSPAASTKDTKKNKDQAKTQAQPETGAPAAGNFTAVKAPEQTQTRQTSDSSPLGAWLPVIPIAVAALVLAFTARRSLRVARRRPGR